MPAPARPRWGFHQLSDHAVTRLVSSSGVGPGDLVLDVGAGTGGITDALVAAGARVVAIELHPRRLAVLRDRYASRAEVTVVRADAVDLRLPTRPFHVVANPPFATITALLRRLLAPGSRLQTAHLVVPVHAAARWSRGDAPGAGRWQRQFDARVGHRVAPAAFLPTGPPSAVLVVERRNAPRRRQR